MSACPNARLQVLAVVVCVLGGAPAGEASFAAASGGPSPIDARADALWQAVCAVESGHRPHAYNARTKAAGVAQIRPICVSDCNRIAREGRDGRRWRLADRWCPDRSREMFELYTRHWARRRGPEAAGMSADELRARIWYAGPVNYRSAAADAYWRKVADVRGPGVSAAGGPVGMALPASRSVDDCTGAPPLAGAMPGFMATPRPVASVEGPAVARPSAVAAGIEGAARVEKATLVPSARVLVFVVAILAAGWLCVLGVRMTGAALRAWGRPGRHRSVGAR